MKEIKCYAVVLPSEQTRQAPVELACFSDLEDAKKLSKEHSSMGAYLNTKTIVVFDSYEEYKAEDKRKLRASALAKLTIEEKNALGL